MAAFLLGPIGKVLGVVLAVLALLGGCYAKGRSDERAKLSPEIAQLKSDVKGWKAYGAQSEGYRKQEREQAEGDLQSARTACTAEKASLRKSWEARSKVYARPVKFDAANCPLRELVAARDLGLK